MTFLNIATIVSMGLMIGAEFAVSVFINPVLRRLSDREQIAIIRLFAARLGAAMPLWYALNFALLIATLVLHREASLPLLAAATSAWAAIIVLTLIFLVPINNRMARLSASAPVTESLRDHRRWDSLHRLRVLALAVVMVTYLAGIHL